MADLFNRDARDELFRAESENTFPGWEVNENPRRAKPRFVMFPSRALHHRMGHQERKKNRPREGQPAAGTGMEIGSNQQRAEG